MGRGNPGRFRLRSESQPLCRQSQRPRRRTRRIDRFVDSGITALGDKLGPLLWQLSGYKKFDPDEIEGFFSNLPDAVDGRRLRHVIEPRHPSFVSAAFVEIARRHGVAICLAIAEDYPLIADPTADFCYLRLQTTSDLSETGYDAPVLRTWASRVGDLAAGGFVEELPLLVPQPAPERPRDCFVYMIAGAKERNPAAAKALIEMLA
jgi:Uncharacterized conserved protein